MLFFKCKNWKRHVLIWFSWGVVESCPLQTKKTWVKTIWRHVGNLEILDQHVECMRDIFDWFWRGWTFWRLFCHTFGMTWVWAWLFCILETFWRSFGRFFFCPLCCIRIGFLEGLVWTVVSKLLKYL